MMKTGPDNNNKTPFKPVKPGVVLSAGAQQAFKRGIASIVDAVRPTLGPFPRLVAVSRSHAGDPPELLDDGGLIARRIVAIEDRDADMGAMFVRHVLWRLREEVGDGTASAAVMLKSIYDEGLKCIAAGWNAMLLREALEDFLPVLARELSSQAKTLSGGQALRDFAQSVCADEEIAGLLSEIFAVIGADGHLLMDNARGQVCEREFIEGSLWEGGLISRNILDMFPQMIVRLENCAIVLTDLEINDAGSLLPVMRLALENGYKAVAVVARKISEDALALMMNANRSGNLNLIGLKTPGLGTTDQFANLLDMGVLTGARVILSATGENLANIRAEDVGLVRRLWADSDFVGLIGGKGDPLELRAHIARIRTSLQASDSADMRSKLYARIGRLHGGAGRLLVGGSTESEQKHRRELAGHTALIMRAALREGILPGGGAAYRACRSVLAPTENETGERALARGILSRALEQPMINIAANAGYEIHALPAGLGLDVRTGQPADMLAVGVMDAAGVCIAVVNAALRGAALALTVEALVHHASPQFSAEP